MSRQEWLDAHSHVNGADPIANAVVFFIDCRQSRSGMMNTFTSVTRNRLRRRMNGNTSEWLSAVEGLPDVHRRLSRVLIEKMNALDLIAREDTPATLFYCDPPYLHETRTAPNAYAHEMSEAKHRELLATLAACKYASGYPSTLYDSALKSWTRHTFELPNNAAGGAPSKAAG